MINEKIIEIRQKKRLTQAEFGEVLGIAQFTISRIERGQQEVDLKMLIGLAKHFDVNLHEFITNPYGGVHIVTSSSIVSCVLAKLQEVFNV